MADENAFGSDTAKRRPGRFQSQGRMDAERLVAGQEVVDGSDRLGDHERSVGRIIEGHLLPEAVVDDGDRPEPGVGEFVVEPSDRGVDVAGDAVEPLREVNRNVVAVRDRRGVAFVSVESDDDAGHVAELGQQIVEPLGVDRIDHPDLTVDLEGVTGPLHPFVGVGDPPDTAVESIDLSELRCSFVGAKTHVVCYGPPTHKRR